MAPGRQLERISHVEKGTKCMCNIERIYMN
jgi:hypothetical protein